MSSKCRSPTTSKRGSTAPGRAPSAAGAAPTSAPSTPFAPPYERDPRAPKPPTWYGGKERLPEPQYLPQFKNYQFRYGAYPGFRDCSKNPPWPDGAVSEHERRQNSTVKGIAGRACAGRTTFKRHERVCGDLQFGRSTQAKKAHEFMWYHIKDPNQFNLKAPRRWNPAGVKLIAPRPFYNREDGHFLLNNTCTIVNLCLLPELRRLQCYFLPKLPKIRVDRNFYLPMEKTPKSPSKPHVPGLSKPIQQPPLNVGARSHIKKENLKPNNHIGVRADAQCSCIDHGCQKLNHTSVEHGRQHTRWRWTETWKRQLIPWYTNYGDEDPEIAAFKAAERLELDKKHSRWHYWMNREGIERLRAWHRRVRGNTPPPKVKPIDYHVPAGKENVKFVRKVKDLFEDPILWFWADRPVDIMAIILAEEAERRRLAAEAKRKNPTPPPPPSICSACDYFGDDTKEDKHCSQCAFPHAQF